MAYNDFDINEFSPGWAASYGNQQKTEEQGLLGGLTGYVQGLEGVPQMYDRYANQYFIPQLTEQALSLGELGTGLTSQIQGMPEQVAGTSRESLLTEGQKQGMVQSKQAPLYQSLSNVQTAQQNVGARLAAGQQAANTMMGYEMQQQERGMLPFEVGIDLATQRWAREQTGYTFDQQQELDRLISNQNAGITLSEGEKNRMNELALAEWSYKQAIDSVKESGNQTRLTKKAPGNLTDLYSSIFG